MPYGTLDVFGSLAAQAGSQTVFEFGEDQVWEEVEKGLRIHNELMRQVFAARVERTTDRARRYGGAPQMDMPEIDEYGVTDAQKIMTGVNLGLPLRKYDLALQFTRTWLQVTPVTELVEHINAARTADRRRLQLELLRTMFTPTNNLTYVDALRDKVVLPLRALLNGDGSPVPANPYNGATFNGSTHTHFLYATALNNAAMEAVVTTVQEHGVEGTLQIEINQAQVAAVKALTDFVGVDPVTVIRGGGSTVSTAPGQLDTVDTTNRLIGYWNNFPVWVKPWQFAGYVTVWDTGAPPIALRRREGESEDLGDLQFVYENETYPLRASVARREFGFGVVRRHKMAHLYVDGAAVAYVMPTIPRNLTLATA